MVRAWLALAVFGLLIGCGSNETAPAETKANQVAPQLSPEQQSHLTQHAGDPNYDPSEAASKQRKQ